MPTSQQTGCGEIVSLSPTLWRDARRDAHPPFRIHVCLLELTVCGRKHHVCFLTALLLSACIPSVSGVSIASLLSPTNLSCINAFPPATTTQHHVTTDLLADLTFVVTLQVNAGLHSMRAPGVEAPVTLFAAIHPRIITTGQPHRRLGRARPGLGEAAPPPPTTRATRAHSGAERAASLGELGSALRREKSGDRDACALQVRLRLISFCLLLAHYAINSAARVADFLCRQLAQSSFLQLNACTYLFACPLRAPYLSRVSSLHTTGGVAAEAEPAPRAGAPAAGGAPLRRPLRGHDAARGARLDRHFRRRHRRPRGRPLRRHFLDQGVLLSLLLPINSQAATSCLHV